MPEMTFAVRWPDGSDSVCYSPSLVIRDHFTPGETYALQEFVQRSRTALTIASDRVRQKYGFPCARALGQLAEIERRAGTYATVEHAAVQLLAFGDA